MLRAALLLCWMIIASACSGAVSVPQHLPDAEYQADGSGIRYLNAANTSQIFLSHDVMYVGPTESEALRLHQQMREVHTDGLPVSACSDAQYLCLHAGRWVFAIPRATPSVRQSYAVQGMRFAIDACEGQGCTIATISATCEHFANGVCSLSSEAADRFIMLRFGFDQTKGVTWIAPIGSGNDRYALVGDRGVLAPN